MDKILNIAMQCNSRLKLKALLIICITVIIGMMLISFVAIATLNTVVSYHEADIKVNSSSVNVELDLDR